ncbi:MAG: BatA domain-containing protein [Planctomycetia bacterium]|nr:BatA domain-containing protein [Planctomycetia bacterium]
MTFIHPLLLGGLLLVGIPVLIHLIMQQKPKRLPFAAFRFLMQKARTNQRQLKLRHLLLLTLRMLLIALVCLALARPRVSSGVVDLSARQPVAVALVLDTSMSMEYAVGGKTRLDDAKRRALELLDELPEGSKLAVFDSAEVGGGEWLATATLARERLTGLQLRAANGPLAEAIGQAYRLLHALDDDPEQRQEPMPRFLYVFSDRTRECWDGNRTASLLELRDRSVSKPLAAFVDVGVEQPVDLAVADLELPWQTVPANGRIILRARVQAVGKDVDTELLCRIDGEKHAERKAFKLKAGQNDSITFERRNLPLGLHQAEISLASGDNMPWNNARFATFEVAPARRVLIVSDDPDDAAIWKLALRAGEQKGDPWFDGEVQSTRQAAKLKAGDLARYQAVCLLNVASPEPALWQALREYVAEGGGLAVLPGGDELDLASYQSAEAKQLLPGELRTVVRRPLKEAVAWYEPSFQHPLRGWFADWRKQSDPPVDFVRVPPLTVRYWDVQPGEALTLAVYDDEKKRPAVLERKFDRQQVRGKVLLLTTTFDGRRLDAKSEFQWNDYLSSAFYVSLAKKVVGYLTGDLEDANLNHLCGPPLRLPLPPAGRFPRYVLQGPGLAGQAGLIARKDGQNDLTLHQATQAGNYLLIGGDNQWTTGFSLNVPPAESDLTRVPVEQIEALFGPGSVLPLGHNLDVRSALEGRWTQPVELFPWLMIGLLLFLAVENLLANKFYRQPQTASGEPPLAA